MTPGLLCQAARKSQRPRPLVRVNHTSRGNGADVTSAVLYATFGAPLVCFLRENGSCFGDG